MINSERNAKTTELLTKSGINVIKATWLGSFLHVDSYSKYESDIRSIMSKMGARKITTLTGGADGVHLDGIKSHRIVGQF